MGLVESSKRLEKSCRRRIRTPRRRHRGGSPSPAQDRVPWAPRRTHGGLSSPHAQDSVCVNSFVCLRDNPVARWGVVLLPYARPGALGTPSPSPPRAQDKVSELTSFHLRFGPAANESGHPRAPRCKRVQDPFKRRSPRVGDGMGRGGGSDLAGRRGLGHQNSRRPRARCRSSVEECFVRVKHLAQSERFFLEECVTVG